MQKLIINPRQWTGSFSYNLGFNTTDVAYSEDFCIGLAALDEAAKPLSQDMDGQLHSCFHNLASELDQLGYSFENVEQLNIYITSIDEFFPAYRKVIHELPEHNCVPVGTLTEVDALAIPQLKVKIEATFMKSV